GKIRSGFESLRKVMHLGRSEDVFFLRSSPEIIDFKVKELKDFKQPLGTYLVRVKSSPIDNEEHIPVYSIPVKSIFHFDNRPIRNLSELLNNKDQINRQVEYKTVYYLNGSYLSLKEKQPIQIYTGKFGGQDVRYYLTEQSWL